MALNALLEQYFGYDRFRPFQKEAIKALLAGKHVLAIMPTGSGKSMIYQIAALSLPDLTIVISPLIALMKDQVDGLRRRGIDAAYINSTLTRKEREERYEKVRSGHYKILYVTPERFRKKTFVDVLRSRAVSLLAVDEAHCISQWGHDFRPDYTRLHEFRKIMGDPTTIALTATATPQVQQDIVGQLELPDEQTQHIHLGIERPNLYLEVLPVYGETEKLALILKRLNETEGSGIIYFVLIKDLLSMSALLSRRRIPHSIYHGELEPPKRRRLQNQFMNRKNQLVLATNAFGMGIDKPDIRFVMHAQIPGSLEAYYQEIGRAGRDGKPSFCSLLYDEEDLNIQMQFIKWKNPSLDFIYRAYQILITDIERVNGEGMEYFKEQLTYKDRFDYRAETTLNLFDRWAVTEGSVEQKNLKLTGELPSAFSDDNFLQHKLKNEQQKLYQMMRYARTQGCRRAFIHNYFNLPHQERCGRCDNDSEAPAP